MKMKWIGILILGVFVNVTEAAAEKGEGVKIVNSVVEEARQKVAEGDKEKAALLYYQASQMDNTNHEARRELTSLLVESQINAPESEQSGVMAILENHVTFPPFPAERFPLTFLNNGALTAGDGSMNHQVLLILQKLQNNDNESAVKLAERLNKKYPFHPVPYNLLGLAWQGKGDPSKAHEFFEKALALKENFHAARINLAELELHLGEFNAAHQALDAVLSNDIHNRRACLVKAQLYSLEGQSELANRWYSKVSESL